jgi:precorrin-6B methylase 2
MSARAATVAGLRAAKVAVGSRYRAIESRIGRALFERGDFVDTAPLVHLHEIGLGDEERNHYEASPWLTLPRVLRVREVRPHDVFVEYGCGKGRVVFQAAKGYPFRRVIGVDIAPQLTAVARENIRRNREQLKCRDVEIVTADATEFEPPDDMTHAYFYNPFGGQVFERVIEKIVRSLDRNPRTVTIIYCYPFHADVLERTGRFEHVRTSKGVRRRHVGRWISVYRSLP